jgi:Tfp pilus assembly protein PilF
MRLLSKKSWEVLLGSMLAILLLLAGCAPPKVGLPGPETRPEPAVSPAAAPLLAGARQALAHKDLHGAEAYLERAIRLEPGNGLLWHTLAETKYRQGDYGQAVQLSLRATTFLPAAGPLIRENYLLMARAYRKLGQDAQARQAAARAGSL